MSMLSGYPMGAKLVADCCENGIVSKEEAKRLLAFTSTSGPLFVLGTVGSNMLGNYKAGLVILFTHYLGAVINGIIFRSKTPAPSAKAFTLTKYDNILSDAINGSIASVLAVGGYIAIFNMLIVLFKDIKLIGFVSETLSGLGIPYLLCEGMVTGVIEITRGSYLLAASGESLKAIVPLLSAIISFGGLSVTVQSLSFLSGCGIKARYFFVTKLSQCVVTFCPGDGCEPACILTSPTCRTQKPCHIFDKTGQKRQSPPWRLPIIMPFIFPNKAAANCSRMCFSRWLLYREPPTAPFPLW